MPIGVHVIYAFCAAVIAVAAVVLARQMTEGWSAPLAVLVLFASWALFVWLTPLGPYVWRASALGFLAVGGTLVGRILVGRGVPFAPESEASIPAATRRAIVRRGAVLLLLIFSVPVVAHMAAYGSLPMQH